MKQKSIIHVSSYYPPHLGGQENAVHGLATHLAADGKQVHVITSTIGGGPKGVSVEQAVQVHRMSGKAFGHAPIMPCFPRALFRAAKPDSIVHLHIGQAFTPEIVWLVSKLRRFKYVAQLHIDFEPSGPAGILLPLYKKFVLPRVLRAASAVVTLNQKTLRLVRDFYGYTGPIHVMDNGIDEAFFSLQRLPLAPHPPKILRLLFVGRLSKQKNILALLKALTLTKRRVHLDIIGEGDQREAIQKMIADCDLTNVTLHGRLPRDDVTHFYETCDALIMPSLYEAQPLVLLEALAARIPIIGTSVIGVEDHLRGAGIIVKPTAAGLAGGIERYFTQYALLAERSDRGYETANRLRWPHVLKKYESLYEQILAS